MRINIPLISQIDPWELSVLHIQSIQTSHPVAFLIYLSSSVNFREETEFLASNGLEHLAEKFQQEEISMEIMGELTDVMLRELGISMIGARI